MYSPSTRHLLAMGRFAAVFFAVAVSLFTIPPRAVAWQNDRARATKVEISGGADASGHQYTWKITNRSQVPIVAVDIPHYRATLFFPPDGWTQDCTFLVNVGVKSSPGVCSAKAEPVQGAIRPGRSLEFKMQVGDRTVRGGGEVVVYFQNGEQTRIGGVELPIREPSGDQMVPLIGMGVAFLVFILAGKRRRRSSTNPSTVS